jgi:hypothetical protein
MDLSILLEKTINRTAKQGEGSTKSFACPFYKHDPIKYGAYQDKRKCDRIGWADISRLKCATYFFCGFIFDFEIDC